MENFTRCGRQTTVNKPFMKIWTNYLRINWTEQFQSIRLGAYNIYDEKKYHTKSINTLYKQLTAEIKILNIIRKWLLLNIYDDIWTYIYIQIDRLRSCDRNSPLP